MGSLAQILATMQSGVDSGGGGGDSMPPPDLTEYKPSQVQLDPSAIAKIVGYGDDTMPFPPRQAPMTKREKIIDALNRMSNNFLGRASDQPTMRDKLMMQKENADWRKSRAVASAKWQEEQDKGRAESSREQEMNRRLDIAQKSSDTAAKRQDANTQQGQERLDLLLSKMNQQGDQFQQNQSRQQANEADRMNVDKQRLGIERGNLGVRQQELALQQKKAGQGEDAPLTGGAQGILQQTRPTHDQIRDLIAQIEPMAAKDPGGRMSKEYALYKLGIHSDTGAAADTIAQLNLNRIAGAARVMKGSSRAYPALQRAMEHLPNAWVDTKEQMLSKLKNLDVALGQIEDEAVSFGKKGQTVGEAKQKLSVPAPTQPEMRGKPGAGVTHTYDPNKGLIPVMPQ